MLSRRRFLTAAVVLPATMNVDFGITPEFDEALELNGVQIPDEILNLENVLRRRPGVFLWSVHNDLRHHYLSISQKMSYKHIDIILSKSMMDNYTLNVLSDWHIEHDPMLAAAVLVKNAEEFVYFRHLAAACLIKAGDLFAAAGMLDQAAAFYQGVLNIGSQNLTPVQTLRPYHMLAQARLMS